METWDALTARRNVRQYTNTPIDSDLLTQILEAGRRAPSAKNWQPWDFVAVVERDQLRELSEAGRYASHVADSTATIALVIGYPEDEQQRDWAYFDLGQATANMMITAADLGIGGGHASVTDQDRARQVLGFPEERFCPYLLAFGRPADRPLTPIANPNRRSFDDVVHWSTW